MASLPPLDPQAAYFHVPFCLHRCGYCDFTLVAGKDHLIGAYLRGLERELGDLRHPREVSTLFLGGGTPTHLPAADLARLLDLVRAWFPLREGYEFTVEANPAGLDESKLEVLASRGVNRVSLGIQSFDAQTLSVLERDHRRADIEFVLPRLRQYFENLSFDLIFGVPGQTLPLWVETLHQAVEFGPEHLSTYGLTYERGTNFWSRLQKGGLRAAPEELERDMYAAAMDELAAAGFEQYELSNFARAGRRCRHNEVYWSGLPYFAFGPGAARYLGGRRQTNHRSVTTWIKRLEAGISPIAEDEELAPEDRARELIMLGLRRNAGIDRALFRAQTGFALEELAGAAIERHRQAGLVEFTDDSFRLTREGRFLADHVIVDFL
jgi:oxygen-independent coproporphyrinogen-3 oxidase